jgi:uncharacterized protein HemX
MLTIIAVVVIVGIGATIYYISKKNRDRKENLNIVKKGNKLYFYLSDDYFFSINLEKNKKLAEVVTKAVKDEMEYLRKSVRKINFINFENKKLEELLNSMLNLRREQL